MNSKEKYLFEIKKKCEYQKIKGRQNLVYLTYYNFIKYLINDIGFDHNILDKYNLFPTLEDTMENNLTEMYFTKLKKEIKKNNINNKSLKDYLLLIGIEECIINKHYSYLIKYHRNNDLYGCFIKLIELQENDIYDIFN